MQHTEAGTRDPVVYHIIMHEWEALGEPSMPAFLDELSKRGADCCWYAVPLIINSKNV